MHEPVSMCVCVEHGRRIPQPIDLRHWRTITMHLTGSEYRLSRPDLRDLKMSPQGQFFVHDTVSFERERGL